LPLPGDQPPGPGASARRSHLYERPGLKLRRCHQIATALFEQAIGDYNLTSPQYGALEILKEFPGIDQIRLSRLFGYDRSTIGGIVNQLEARGMIERRPDPADARGRILTITPAAQEALERGSQASQYLHQKLLEPLSSAQRAALIEAMDVILDAYNTSIRAPLQGMEGAGPDVQD